MVDMSLRVGKSEGRFHGHGSAGDDCCGARVEAAVRFEGSRLAEVEITAEGASTAKAAASALSDAAIGADWRQAASLGAVALIDRICEGSGEGGRRSCPPDQAARFAVEALHRAFEDAIRRDSFPLAASRKEESVIVAMSGGVDSTAACLLLSRAGSRVTGVTMRLWSDGDAGDPRASCCSPQAIEDARGTCHALGVPHLTIDCRKEFADSVVSYFVDEYTRGRTPNPCAWCNGNFRFPLLDSIAARLGANKVATGHYARIIGAGPSGAAMIARGLDQRKDQSYMLWGVPAGLLQRIDFPLGRMKKRQTRDLVEAAGLEAARRAESQEICFIPDDDYRSFLRSRDVELPGPGDIVDRDGRVLGRHGSIVDFTIGQRRRLGVSSSEPLYVIRTVPSLNQVVVGPRAELAVRRIRVGKINSFVPRDEIRDCLVQVRYNSAAVPASVKWSEDSESAQIELHEEVLGAAPGQSAVMYGGELLLAGGVIDATG